MDKSTEIQELSELLATSKEAQAVLTARLGQAEVALSEARPVEVSLKKQLVVLQEVLLLRSLPLTLVYSPPLSDVFTVTHAGVLTATL